MTSLTRHTVYYLLVLVAATVGLTAAYGLGTGMWEGRDAALRRIMELSNLEKYKLKFFLGTLLRFPQSFTIVGLWYPKRADVRRRGVLLFS